ncbi:MAG: hypothetical protein IPG76_20545 [Acidobacteria bacterium]|nr:hypothetical protein [Acidobacteriota bacterium]
MNKISMRVMMLLVMVILAVTYWAGGRNLRVEAASSSTTVKKGQATPTFNKEVVRILQKNCQTCHHPGDIAPFSMMSYKETRPWAKSIREQVLLRKMPPWKPIQGCGDFRDVRALSDADIQTLVAWADGGSPEGSPADLPPPMDFPDGWPLGAPDLVVNPQSDYSPPVSGDMYRCFSVPVGNLRGDRWISALSVKPGNPKIVHHVIAYADPTGESAKLDDNEPGPGYTCFGGPKLSNTDMLGGWAPGSRGYFAPDGTGIKLSNNSRVVIQVHYHPIGEAETDRTPVGLYFAKAPVGKQLQVLPLVNTTFAIPAGAKTHEVTANFSIPVFLSAQMWAVTPHMHLLGKKIKVELFKPGSDQPECLVNIDSWDFNWQGTYLYKNAVTLAGGSRLKLTTIFDNSIDNPLNPNTPPKIVRWGEETTDEMSLAFVGFTLDGTGLPISSPIISDVLTDQDGNLVVNGSGFLPGADIEIDGHSLRDTTTDAANQSKRLSSADMWKVLAEPGREVSVSIINPDGLRTSVRKFTRQVSAGPIVAVSAANYSTDSLTPSSIIAVFGTNLATASASAPGTPLPTSLNGTSVRVNGVAAPLFFVAPGQVNFLVPDDTLTGNAVVEIVAGNNNLSRGTINLSAAAPSLFTSNSQGTGAPAALSSSDGVTYNLTGNPDGSSNKVYQGDYLVLFGTGIRRASKSTISITIGGQPVPVLFAGAQGDYAGLDQINTRIPQGISGLVDLIVAVNGKQSNVVKIRIN